MSFLESPASALLYLIGSALFCLGCYFIAKALLNRFRTELRLSRLRRSVADLKAEAAHYRYLSDMAKASAEHQLSELQESISVLESTQSNLQLERLAICACEEFNLAIRGDDGVDLFSVEQAVGMLVDRVHDRSISPESARFIEEHPEMFVVVDDYLVSRAEEKRREDYLDGLVSSKEESEG